MSGVKTIISIILYYLGLLFNWRKNRVLSIYFHNPKPESFERIIRWSVRHNYKFIDLSQLMDYVEGRTPLNGNFLYVSFDDAKKENLELIPIIEKYNLPVTLFSPIEPLKSGNYWWEYVAGYGGWSLVKEFKTYEYDKFVNELGKVKNQVRLIRTAMTMEDIFNIEKNSLINLQSHSYTHPILTNLSLENLEFELKESQKVLSELLNKEIYAFSYPNGTLGEREFNEVKKYYKCAFTTVAGDPEFASNPYMIPRISLADDYWSNLAKIMKMWIYRK